MSKRIISLFLSLIVLITSFSIVATAEDNTTENEKAYTYNSNDGKATVIAKGTHLTITIKDPAKRDSYAIISEPEEHTDYIIYPTDHYWKVTFLEDNREYKAILKIGSTDRYYYDHNSDKVVDTGITSVRLEDCSDLSFYIDRTDDDYGGTRGGEVTSFSVEGNTITLEVDLYENGKVGEFTQYDFDPSNITDVTCKIYHRDEDKTETNFFLRIINQIKEFFKKIFGFFSF